MGIHQKLAAAELRIKELESTSTCKKVIELEEINDSLRKELETASETITELKSTNEFLVDTIQTLEAKVKDIGAATDVDVEVIEKDETDTTE